MFTVTCRCKKYIIVYNNTASNISNKLINDDNITLFKIFISNTNINFDTNNIEENIKEGDIINVEVIKNYAKLVGSDDLLFLEIQLHHIYILLK